MAKPTKHGIGSTGRPWACDLWPGITTGFDARCTCTWAPLAGVYQVKVRDGLCLTHGGALEAAMIRAARPAT